MVQFTVVVIEGVAAGSQLGCSPKRVPPWAVWHQHQQTEHPPPSETPHRLSCSPAYPGTVRPWCSHTTNQVPGCSSPVAELSQGPISRWKFPHWAEEITGISSPNMLRMTHCCCLASIIHHTKALCSSAVMIRIKLLGTKEERLGHNQKCLESISFFYWKFLFSNFHS